MSSSTNRFTNKNRKHKKRLFASILLMVSFSPALFAYIDPGTGSILFSVISALVLTVLFSLKGFFYKLIFSLSGKKQNVSPDFSGKLVFFNEGKNYWKIFKPVLSQLTQKNIDFVYLTADKQDPALTEYGEKSFFIGTIQNAVIFLNKLKADVCVMTTPQLNVLHLKRSIGVRCYCHLMHAPGDIHTYKKFAFDYYDAVLCANQMQIDNIRYLEKKRNKPQKLLFESGCTLFDDLPPAKEASEVLRFLNAANEKSVQSEKILLIAPTWGEKSFLAAHGYSFIDRILLQTDYTILFRPHPQSFVSDAELIHEIEETYKNNPRFLFDKNVNNLDSIDVSSCMICDISGVAFDFIFRKQKPIIVVDQTKEMYGYENADLEKPDCLFDFLREIKSPVITDFSNIVPILKSLESLNVEKSLIEKYHFNYAHSAPIIADQIVSLLEQN